MFKANYKLQTPDASCRGGRTREIFRGALLFFMVLTYAGPSNTVSTQRLNFPLILCTLSANLPVEAMMQPLTLSRRLFLVTAVALLPSLAILFSSIRVSLDENEKNVHLQAARTSELAALELERLISGAESVLRALAVTPIVRAGDVGVCSDLVADMAKAIPSLSAITVIDPDGFPRCAPIGQKPVPYLGDREYFIEAAATSERVVGTFTIGRTTGKKVLPVALQIGGTDGAPSGVAVAYIDLDWLEARLQERTYVPDSSLTIADRNGTILARVPEPERFVGTDIPDEYQYLLTLPEPGTLPLTSQDGTRRVIGYVPVTARPQGLYVSSGFATDSAFASTQAIAQRGILIGIAGILLALFLATYTSQVFIARPVQTLVKTVQAWRSGKTDARTGMSAADGELGSAGQAFDSFIVELLVAREARQRADEQRQMLLAELDHRGRNLLAMIQAVARRTFSQNSGEPEMKVFSARLQAIGEANSMLRQDNWRSASLSVLVRTALNPFVDLSTGRITICGPEIFVLGDVVLPVSMAFHELGTNAVKYGALSNETGTVSISWRVEPLSDGARLELVWKERGGPPVVTPQRRGFGSTIIAHVLSAHTGGDVELAYDPAGLVCRITFRSDKMICPTSES